MLGQMSYAGGPMCSVFPNHMDGTWATRESIWVVTAATRASGRNIRLAVGSGVVGSYQWLATVPGILQEAAEALVYTAGGFAYAWLSGSSPEAAVQIGDIMTAAAAMGPEKAETLAKKVMDRVDELAKTETPRPTMITFKDVYDIEKLEPFPEHKEYFNRTREELAALGVL